MHRIDLGQVAAECASGAHLDATDRLQVCRGLHQAGVARCFPRVLHGGGEGVVVGKDRISASKLVITSSGGAPFPSLSKTAPPFLSFLF